MGKWKIANILEMAYRRAKRSKICDSGIVFICMWGYILPFSVEGHFGVIRCTCFKMTCNLKAAGCRVKRGEIWGSEVVVTCIWGIFDLSVFKVILRSFGPFVSKCPVIGKRLAVELNELKFVTRG